jgi:predicted permease
VLSAGYANQLPLVALENSTTLRFTPAPPSAGERPSGAGADVRLVSSGFLQAIGVRVIDGRLFNAGDGASSPRVLLINRAFAHKSFSDRPAVGTIVYTGRDTAPWEIVGVVDDVRQSKLNTPPAPQFFAILDQWASPSVPVFPLGAYYAVRTASTPTRLLPAVRQVVGRLNAQAVLENVVTMDDVVSNAASQPRLYAVLLGTFSAVAVLLAAAGIYGVMAYRVAQRTREIGIRMALGARRADVLGLVIKQSALLTCAGTALGVAGAAAATKSLQSLLFGLEPLDVPTFAGVAVLFVAIATLASYIPARRAATVDPLIALRAE